MDHNVVEGDALACNTVAMESTAVAEDSVVPQQPKKRRHRTTFHYVPKANWMNDPNGPFYYKGYYHLFYQYNPKGAIWGDITWGHAVSKNLVHWLYLEDALKPDQWYDSLGVWSGSTTIGPDGIPFIIYTGGSGSVLSALEQLQCIAVPADPSDPLLREWVKVPENPIAAHPPGVGEQDFRDPSTAWQHSNGTWVFTVGAKTEDAGISLLYTSRDLKKWELEEKLLHSGPHFGMWECVDFFTVDHDVPTGSDPQKYVFKISHFDEKRDYYTIGTYDEDAHKFTPDHEGLDVGLGHKFDYGKYYAAKSFFDPVKNRRINWAWVAESCTQEMDIENGWSSIMGVPRTLTLDSQTGVHLIQWPIEEIESLRTSKVSQTDVNLDAGAVVEVKGVAGDQLDVEVIFELPDTSAVGVTDEADHIDAVDFSQCGHKHCSTFGPFGLFVLTDERLEEKTAVFFRIARSSEGIWTSQFCHDPISSSKLADNIDKPVYDSTVEVLPTEDFLALRLLVDRSVLESFVQGGRVTVTSRVYPKEAVDEQAKVYLFNYGKTPITVRSITAYHMTEAVFTDDPLEDAVLREM
jgi:beta-fructofuranosidase